MSLESGKKLGLTASLIAILVPVVAVVLYVSSFLSLFGLISPTFLPSPFFGVPAFSGLSLAFLALGIIGLIGIILFLFAMHRLSEYYSEPGIFKNALYGFLTNIVGGTSLIAILVAVLLITVAANHSAPGFSGVGLVIGGFLGIYIVIFVLAIIAAIFYKNAFEKLAEKSGVSNFKDAGSKYLTGTILTIILVGAIIVWIAWIDAASGFRALKPREDQPSVFSYYSKQPAQAGTVIQKKYCVYCGAQINADSIYCPNCGNKLQ